MEALLNSDGVSNLARFLSTRDFTTFDKGVSGLDSLSKIVRNYTTSPEYWKMRAGRLLKFRIPAEIVSVQWKDLYRSVSSRCRGRQNKTISIGKSIAKFSFQHSILLYDWWISKVPQIHLENLHVMVSVWALKLREDSFGILSVAAKYLAKSSSILALLQDALNKPEKFDSLRLSTTETL